MGNLIGSVSKMKESENGRVSIKIVEADDGRELK